MEKDKGAENGASSKHPGTLRASFLTGWILPGLIICLSAFFSWTGTKDKAPTFDELIHVTSGVAYWTLQDYRVQPENGNLPQRIAGLPHYLLGTYPEIDTSNDDWAKSRKWHIANTEWYQSDGDPETITRLSRAAMLTVNLLGLLLVFRLSLSMWGLAGGYLSLLLAAFSPNFLGHMPLATSDFMGAWSLILAIAAYAKLCENIRPKTILMSGFAVGLALLSKHSAVAFGFVAVGMFLYAILIQKPSPQRGGIPGTRTRVVKLLGASVLAALVALATVWAFHSWRFSAHNPEAGAFTTLFLPFEEMNAGSPFIQYVTGTLLRLHVLPEAFVYGLSYVLDNDTRTNFLNGEFRHVNGFLLYFVFCFLYKTPFPAIFLHLVGSASAIFFVIRKGPRLSVLLFGLILTVGFFGVMLIRSDMNIGYRHAFLLLCISCILCGSLIRNREGQSKIVRSVAFILAISLVPLAWISREHYISYVNALGGGEENGFRVLRESSLDWGQDLPSAVELMVETNQLYPDKTIYFSYFGSAEPEAYAEFEREFLPGFGNHDQKRLVPRLEAGLYVISASSMIANVNGWPSWLEHEYLNSYPDANKLYEQLKSSDSLEVSKARELLTPNELDFLFQFESLRFARLWKPLQYAEPDQVLHGSILVYDLNAEEMAELGF